MNSFISASSLIEYAELISSQTPGNISGLMNFLIIITDQEKDLGGGAGTSLTGEIYFPLK